MSGLSEPAPLAQPLFVPHPSPLIEGRLRGRRERFLADVELADGTLVVAHCVNPGRMEGLVVPGGRVWLLPAPESAPGKPQRKLAFTWELSELLVPSGEPGRKRELNGVFVGANTARPNALVMALVAARLLSGLDAYEELAAERTYGERSRIDLYLRQNGVEHFVEVKNCHLVNEDLRGYFPDSVSERATKHLGELEREVTRGARATVLFTVQRADALALRPSDVHDPTFAAALRRAAAHGVSVRAVRVEPRLDGYHLTAELPVELAPYDRAVAEGARAASTASSGWTRNPR